MSHSSMLGEGEHVVLDLRTHVKALLGPLVVLLLALAAVGAAYAFIPGVAAQLWLQLAVVALAVVAVLVWAFVPFLRWSTSRYTITNRRLITRSGIITRTGRDIPLYRINDIAYEMGLVDRLLGCGTLVISDATDKAGVVLHDIPRIESVQLQLSELLFAADDGSDDGEFPPTEPRRAAAR
ncbi:PH domain-containing protein [Sanguibacter antarcticus]|uniref:PH (Pleckstrin Homology) domain-containing protein n=1 Tax=Sanguibacter antarcticus TaxID=372484 RepID=A0A2A9E977_9MICO|nr:PH domain-containing protein [Sanguibacter antarcticus]PFG34789.1 PH (Pleckstrin Homology) domain-containing protein [Sanguibacter antarcticus]